MAFGRALQFDETAAVVHHHVHVGVAVAVLGIVEVEHRHALVDAGRYRGDRAHDRVAADVATRLQPADRIAQRHVGAGDRRGAGAAVGLQHVAVERDGAFAQGLAVDAGAQAPADQALDLQRAATLLATRGLAVVAGVGGARQHAVFRRHPAFALAAQETRRLVVDAGGAQHLGVAEADQHRALGVFGVAPLDAHGAHLVGGAAAGADGAGHGGVPAISGRLDYHSPSHTPGPPMIRSMTAFAA